MTATALKSNRQMKEELALRSLTDELQVLRLKIDNHPDRYSGFGKLLERAEASVLARNVRGARDDLIAIKQRLDERDAELDTAARLAEQEKLSDARGAPTHKSETGVATRDGWLWLVNKGRYSPARVEAGRLFREKFTRATDDSMKSCLNDTVGGSGGDSNPMAARKHAQFEINGVRSHMISSAGYLAGDRLFALMCDVVGNGQTIRQRSGGKDRDADAMTIELGFALDLAGVYLGAVRI